MSRRVSREWQLASNINPTQAAAARLIDSAMRLVPEGATSLFGAWSAADSDLAFQQPTKYELMINLEAAKGLGLELSPAVLALADEVIE